MMNRFVSSIAVAALASVALGGCAVRPKFIPNGAKLSQTESYEACVALTELPKKLSSLRALVGATVVHDDESISFRYAIAAVGTKKLRVDVLPPEGAMTLALLVVQGNKTTLLDVQKKEAVIGSNATSLIERLTGLRGMSPTSVVGLVSGRLPELDCSDVAVYPTADGAFLVLENAARTAWHVEPASSRVTKLQILDERGEEVVLDATVHPSGNGAQLQLYSPVEASGELTVQKFVENPGIPVSVFEVSIPGNYTVRDEG